MENNKNNITKTLKKIVINFFFTFYYNSIQRLYFIQIYYIPINDTSFELSIFWPSDTESQINELRFSDSISLSFNTRLTSVTCFCGNVT